MTIYTTETLTYAELVQRVNELGTEYRALEGKDKPFAFQPPAGDSAAWEITFKADPPTRLTDVVFEMQVKPRGEVLGLRVARDEGDAGAKLALDGYYAAVARLIEAIPAVGIIKQTDAALWRLTLEADTQEADELDEIIGYLRLYWFFKRSVNQKKSLAQSTSAATGESSG